MVWCEPDDHPFSETFIQPSVHSSIHLFLEIIRVLHLWCGMEFFNSGPNQQRRPLPSFLSDSSSMLLFLLESYCDHVEVLPGDEEGLVLVILLGGAHQGRDQAPDQTKHRRSINQSSHTPGGSSSARDQAPDQTKHRQSINQLSHTPGVRSSAAISGS